MKTFIFFSLSVSIFFIFQASAFSEERATLLLKRAPAASKEKREKKPSVTSGKIKAAPEAPCADSKEDVLKKLEAKKNAEVEKGKGFSLQGNNDTGCSVK